MRWRGLVAIGVAVALGLAATAQGQTPQRGGTLVFGVGGEPNTFDCHATNTFAVLHYVAPHYSTLLRYDPEAYPRIVGDVAESWSSSADRLTWTFKLRAGVVFHDGTKLTAADVKATLERLRNPPPGVVSVRRSQFADIAAIETPDATTVVVRLSAFDASFESKMASPWNCLYSAAKLAADPEYPQRRVTGTGPFVFVDYQQGKAWNGRRFDRFHHADQPYLEGFQADPVEGPSMVNALAAGHLQAEFRGVTPAQRDRISAARGDKIRFHEGDRISVYVVALNT